MQSGESKTEAISKVTSMPKESPDELLQHLWEQQEIPAD